MKNQRKSKKRTIKEYKPTNLKIILLITLFLCSLFLLFFILRIKSYKPTEDGDSILNKPTSKNEASNLLEDDAPKNAKIEQRSISRINTDNLDSTDSLSSFLANIKQAYPNVVTLYAGAYEPYIQEITVDIPYINEPVVLYLSSYHAANWQIHNNGMAENNHEQKTNIVGVVYGSHKGNSTVGGIQTTSIFNYGKMLGGYRDGAECECVATRLYCSNSDVMQDINKLQNEYGIEVLSYSGEYSPSTLVFADFGTPIDFAQRAYDNKKEYYAFKEQCIASTNTADEEAYDRSIDDNAEILNFQSNSTTYPIKIQLNIGNETAGSEKAEHYLYKLPLVDSTWGDTLNPRRHVPDTGYMAYYLNADNRNRVIRTAQVYNPQKEYSYDEFLNIPSQQFEAYWVGVLRVPQSRFYNVFMDKSWASGRVIIDRHVIAESGQHELEQIVYIPKGNHIVEIEYSNSWHTTDVSVQITPTE